MAVSSSMLRWSNGSKTYGNALICYRVYVETYTTPWEGGGDFLKAFLKSFEEERKKDPFF